MSLSLKTLSSPQLVEGDSVDRVAFDRLITTISTNFINLNPDEIDCAINAALKEIGEFTQVDRSYIFLICDDGLRINNTHEWCAAGIKPQIQQLQGILFDQELPWFARQIRDFQTVHIASLLELPLEANYEKTHFELQGIQSLITVPIICRGRLLGFVGFDSVRIQKTWSNTCIVLLKIVGDIFGSALERQRSERRLQYRMVLEGTLAKISRTLISTGDLNLEQQVLKPLGEVVQVHRVYIFLLHSNGQTMSNTHEWCSPGTMPAINTLQNFTIAPFNWSISQLRQGENLIIHDVAALPAEAVREQEIFQAQTICSMLCVPLYSTAGAFIGFLGFDDTQRCRNWLEEEVQILRLASELISQYFARMQAETALRELNAALEDQVKERTAQLQRALEFESTLKRITDKVRDSLDEGQILQVAVDELALVLNTDSCNTGLYNLQQNTSTIGYEHARWLVPIRGRTVPMHDLPEVYNQLLRGQYFQFCFLAPEAEHGRFTTLVCPIMDDQEVLGDLWLLNPPNLAFDDLEIRLVQQVANQCAIALRQARLYQAAQAQVEELERLNCLKDDFLSTVSHELRSPMSNIKMAIQMLEVLLKQAGLLNSGQSTQLMRYFQILRDECKRELLLINDLLDLSRLDAGVEPLVLTSIDLKIWLPHIVKPFEERASNQQQCLQLSISDELPTVTTDLHSLERILTELLQNACKYTPVGETITIAAHPAVDDVELCVSNSGVEIAASELSRIFEKFYRIPNSDPWRHGGTGLGLALVQRLVKHLGATIQVESGESRTAFVLKLPLDPASPREC